MNNIENRLHERPRVHVVTEDYLGRSRSKLYATDLAKGEFNYAF